MKSTKKLFTGILSFSAFILLIAISTSLSARDYYQIKVYTIKDIAQETRVDHYLEKAYIPALHRAGVKKVGVFKPMEDDPAFGTKIFVFIPLKKLSDFDEIETKLAKDTELPVIGVTYIDATYDNPPYERIESILLKAFADYPDFLAPKFDTPKSEQIFELRSYEGATEKIYQKKVEMFNEGGESDIFVNLGCNPVFFGEVISGSKMPNLMYMTSYENMQSNKDHWAAFRDHPDWKRLSGMEEYKNTVSHIDKWMMHPTEYSDF